MNRKIGVVVIIEMLLLAFFLMPFFKKCETYEYDSSQMKSWTEQGVLLESGYSISENKENPYSGIFTYNPFFNLRKGSYNITIDYSTSGEGNFVYLDSNGQYRFNGLLCDRITLSPNRSTMTFQAYLKQDIDQCHVITRYEGGNLLVKAVKIQRTRDMDRAELVTVIFFIMLLNLCFFLYKKKVFQNWSKEQINVCFILTAAVVLSSYALYTDRVLWGADLVFHLLRIEGVKENLLAGELFGKIQYSFLEGYGYATSVFYPDTLLWFPAILRLIGFTVQRSYKIFVFAMNLALCLSTYFCTKGILKNRYCSALAAVLMLGAPFHLFRTFRDHQVGMFTAAIFLPMIILGLYRIFTMDVKDENYRYTFLLPAVGYAGLLNTHILTTEMAGMITIILCLFLYKKTFRKETFLTLFLTAAVAVVVSLGFLVPFMDYYLFEDFKINANPTELWIQQCGLQLFQLLMMFPFTDRNTDIVTGDNVVIMENPGIAVYILAVVFVYAWVVGSKESRKQMKPIWWIFWIGIGSLFMTTCYFPWDGLRQGLEKIRLEFLVDCIQFPVRYMQIATIALIIPGCYGVKVLFEEGKKELSRTIVVVCTILLMVSSGYMMNHMVATRPERSQYDLQQYLGRSTWSLDEYLPLDTDLWTLTTSGVVTYGDLEISDYEKSGGNIRAVISNHSAEDGVVELPLLFYRGYKAKDANGNRLAVESGKGNVVSVNVPGGYSGTVNVYFHQPVMWRIAEIISVFATISLIAWIVLKKVQEK